jgi:hypothetical protein
MSIPLKLSRQVADRAGALYYRYQMDAWGENPFTVTVWKNWGERLLQNILNHIDCYPEGGEME